MHRADFLSHPDVHAFIPWFRHRFTRDFIHTYTDRRSGDAWRCASLFDAFESYEWNGKGWQDNKRELDTFRRRLRMALSEGDREATFAVCAAILRWGGVWANNGVYLEKRREVLLEELRHLACVLEGEQEPGKHAVRRVPTDSSSECRMNAGFVKIYSVLLDHFVIYDGRVGATLGLLVRRFCEGTQRQAVPEPLRFAYGEPKEAPNAETPKTRNPSAGPFRFPCLRPNSRVHSAQAMRATWLLRAALDGGSSPFSDGEDGFHELAAGLFMAGYDLSPR
jgi:hypothetical protein